MCCDIIKDRKHMARFLRNGDGIIKATNEKCNKRRIIMKEIKWVVKIKNENNTSGEYETREDGIKT